MDDILKIHIRNYNNEQHCFPRDVLHIESKGKVLRTSVKNLEDAKEFFKKYNNDSYVAVFSDWQIKNNTYDTIFIDIDAKTIEESYEKYKKVKEILKYYTKRIYFSGLGMHIFLDFKPTTFNNYPITIKTWLKNIGLTKHTSDGKSLIDTTVIDKRRLARVPCTVNSKNGNYCISIQANDDIDTIKKLAKEGKGHNYTYNMKTNNIKKTTPGNWFLIKKLQTIDKEQETKPKKTITCDNSALYYNVKISEMPVCIQQMIEYAIKSGELDHEPRTALGVFLIHVWSIEKINIMFSTLFSDYNERTTIYQLKKLKERNIKLYSCKKIRTMPNNYCPYKKCKDCTYIQKLIAKNYLPKT